MTTVNEVVQFNVNLAHSGMGVDKDLVHGFQCADVPCYTAKHFFGVDLWGNAINLLDSAESAGWQVVRTPTNEKPRKGAFFVQSVPYHEFGHTGMVYEDSDGYTMKTVEQNIDGNWDALYVGAPARFNTRDFTGITGWFYPPYEDGGVAVQIEPTSQEIELYPENGTFTLGEVPINVRRAPSLNGEVVAVYEPGQSVKYDSKGSANGYRWISYIGSSGKRNYVAIGQTDQKGNRISLWGTLK